MIAEAFVAAPHDFTVSQIGIKYLSSLIFVWLRSLVAGPLNDNICLLLTNRNKKYYEPEFRLVLMSVVLVHGSLGLFGFGATSKYQTHWSGPVL